MALRIEFQAGDDVWLDVERDREPADVIGCPWLLYLRNDQNIEVFYTSTLRLGLPSVSLDAGETKTFTIHLKLHLGGGEFHMGAIVYHCDGSVTQARERHPAKLWTIHDDRFPIGTLFVSSLTDVGGVANLYPEMTIGQSRHSSHWPDRLGDPALEAEVRSVPLGLPELLNGNLGDPPADGDGFVSKLVSTS